MTIIHDDNATAHCTCVAPSRHVRCPLHGDAIRAIQLWCTHTWPLAGNARHSCVQDAGHAGGKDHICMCGDARAELDALR